MQKHDEKSNRSVPRPNGGVITCKNMMKIVTGVKGERLPPSRGYSLEDHGADSWERARGEESIPPDWN